MTTINLKETALRCLAKNESIRSYRHYTGILALHGMARLAVISRDDALLERTRENYRSFLQGDPGFSGNFVNYYCGGNGAAWLHMLGHLPEAKDAIRRYAEETVNESPRDADGIFDHPKHPGEERVWIDVAFAVTPFLLFAGVAFEEERYIEEAFQQTAKMVRLFRNPDNGLLHQARGFNGKGNFSQDHWSRGNGWGIHALTELVNYLPDNDPRRAESEAMFIDLCKSCLAVQDEQGMFHQELTDHSSYVETSGTGLILYAFGVGVERGLLGSEYRAAFETGLRGTMTYIALDGSVHNTCRGCCCPGDGSVEAYKAMPHPVNDDHAFGPVALSFGQALALGIETVEA